MPEGPEVKKNTDYLNSTLQDTRIDSVSIVSGRYAKHGPFQGFEMMEEDDLFIKSVSCKGKFIYFNFSNGASLWSTLGMSGTWQKKSTKHTRITLINSKKDTVSFNDIRNFGTLKYTRSPEELNKKLCSLGPDVLNEEVSVDMFRSRLMSKPNKTIAESLMNQSVVSGVGNYLKAEILYAAKVSPHRLCKDIDDDEYERLSSACHEITRLSYKLGGATLSTYRQSNGEKGLYSRRFSVYNQKRDPLGNEVIKEATQDKRTTHWVPKIQK